MFCHTWKAFGMPPSDTASVQNSRDTISRKIQVDFRINSAAIDSSYQDNSLRLKEMRHFLDEVRTDPDRTINCIEVSGYASPDGSLPKNRELSLRRAVSLRNYLLENCGVPDTLMHFGENSVPWDMFRDIISESDQPWRDEAMHIMSTGSDSSPADNTRRMSLLKRLNNGHAWTTLKQDILPRLRSAYVVTAVVTAHPSAEDDSIITTDLVCDTVPTVETDTIPDLVAVTDETAKPVIESPRPFYMDVNTNMLGDLLLIPNIGVEFYVGRQFSIGASYMHAWWNNDRRHRYWRIYGAELKGRYWLGAAAKRKPLTGHHFGLYAQALTFDFEFGAKAYMGGKPGGTIFDRAHFGAGAEYGFSLPVAKRLNIDFSIGAGYIGGRVYEFVPKDDRYVWSATKNFRWFGPTKLEVSLVWLIGHDNVNRTFRNSGSGKEVAP